MLSVFSIHISSVYYVRFFGVTFKDFYNMIHVKHSTSAYFFTKHTLNE